MIRRSLKSFGKCAFPHLGGVGQARTKRLKMKQRKGENKEAAHEIELGCLSGATQEDQKN